jgi:hypothetical protein
MVAVDELGCTTLELDTVRRSVTDKEVRTAIIRSIFDPGGPRIAGREVRRSDVLVQVRCRPPSLTLVEAQAFDARGRKIGAPERKRMRPTPMNENVLRIVRGACR